MCNKAIWKYKGENANLDNNREIELLDLTSLKKPDLSSINWNSLTKLNDLCKNIIEGKPRFKIGVKIKDMAKWLGQKRKEFYVEENRRRLWKDNYGWPF